ncbi:MAG: PspC domain-containing protein [Actinomycetota bacterium]
MSTPTSTPESPSSSSRTPSPWTRQLRRPVHDKMLAGVAAGIADYLDIDVTLVRIVIAVLSVVGGIGVPIYIAGWLLIPEEGTDQSIAASFIQSHQNRSA